MVFIHMYTARTRKSAMLEFDRPKIQYMFLLRQIRRVLNLARYKIVSNLQLIRSKVVIFYSISPKLLNDANLRSNIPVKTLAEGNIPVQSM